MSKGIAWAQGASWQHSLRRALLGVSTSAMLPIMLFTHSNRALENCPVMKELLKICKTSIDLTKKSDLDGLFQRVEELRQYPVAKVQEAALAVEAPLELKVGYKLLQSKLWVEQNRKPAKIGIAFAMWGEQNRLLPNSAANPNGEDLLRVKIEQLNWLFRDSPLDWHLYAVDDGCPHGSGRIAEEIMADHPDRGRVTVSFLADAVPVERGPLANLQSADDSRKGGAIIYGARQALDDGAQCCVYTDADNSVHLGQLGLLLKPYLDDGFEVVLGNRKDPQSVLVKQESRWGIGIKVLRHMQRMIGVSIFSRGILDSQAAFKLYDRGILEKILQAPSVYDFSFDSDWIACTLANNVPFARVPFAFIDSFAESASIVQGPMTTWETLLKGLATSVKARNVPYHAEMAAVLDRQIESSADLDALINDLPEQLAAAQDAQLGDPEVMSPAELEAWIIEAKARYSA